MDLVFCIRLSSFHLYGFFTHNTTLSEGEPHIAHQCKGAVYFILTLLIDSFDRRVLGPVTLVLQRPPPVRGHW